MPVTSDETASAAERLVVRRSGKALDGIHTSFNRRLCWPTVRWLSHTSVTPNGVTLGGVVVSILSCLFFARGTYSSSVAGALLFFVAGLFDEMDGMLARIRFADSAFGTWFEGIADGLSYLLLFGGITAGLYRQHGSSELIPGMAAAVRHGTVAGGASSSAETSHSSRSAPRASRQSSTTCLKETPPTWCLEWFAKFSPFRREACSSITWCCSRYAEGYMFSSILRFLAAILPGAWHSTSMADSTGNRSNR